MTVIFWCYNHMYYKNYTKKLGLLHKVTMKLKVELLQPQLYFPLSVPVTSTDTTKIYQKV